MGKQLLPDDVRAIFRAFAANRKRVDRPCAECGTLMEQVTTRRRYCSPRCLMRARRRRLSEGMADG